VQTGVKFAAAKATTRKTSFTFTTNTRLQYSHIHDDANVSNSAEEINSQKKMSVDLFVSFSVRWSLTQTQPMSCHMLRESDYSQTHLIRLYAL